MTARIPLLVKIGYGVMEVGNAGTEVLVRLAMLLFYTEVVGLRPDYAGIAIALGVVWDALTDPLMGRFSDVWVFRSQRRRHYFIPGSMLLAICFVGLFSVPGVDSQFGKFLWLLVTYVLVNTFHTVTTVPHMALAGDLTKDSSERTELFGWRLLFGNFGLIFATGLPYIWHVLDLKFLDADRFAAVFMALFGVLTAIITFLATKGRDHAEAGSNDGMALSFIESLRVISKNRSFFNLLIAFFIATIGLTLNSTLALYYYRFRLKLAEDQVRLVLLVFMVMFCATIPLWVKLSARVQKVTLIRINVFALGILTIIAYPLLPAGHAWWPLLVAFPGGLFVASVVLLEAAVADSVELTGGTDFGAYFGIWKLCGKVSRALSIAATGFILQAIGYKAGTEVSDETSFFLAMLFGPGVGVFLLLAVLVLKPHKPQGQIAA